MYFDLHAIKMTSPFIKRKRTLTLAFNRAQNVLAAHYILWHLTLLYPVDRQSYAHV